MKQQFIGTYTFNAATKTVVLQGIDLPLERLYLIVNTTRNIPIFNFAVDGLGVVSRSTDSSVAPNTSFVLEFDTSAQGNSDVLTIFYEDGIADSDFILVSTSRVPASTASFSFAIPPLPAGGIVLLQSSFPLASDSNPWFIEDGANQRAVLVRDDTGVIVQGTAFNGARSVFFRKKEGENSFVLRKNGSTTGMVAFELRIYVSRKFDFGAISTVKLQDASGNPVATAASDPLSTDRGLVVRNVPSGVQQVASQANAALSVRLSNSSNSQIVATKTVNEGISSSDLCVLVKNVNLVRGSGDIFVEERRPDICATGEWLGLFRNNTATMYTAQVSSRRMRVNQILFNWMYAGSQVYDLYGEFVFQWFNSSGNFQAELLRVKKFTSGNLCTLNFPNGFIAPTAGGSIRVLRETWGDPSSTINLHWNISLWEE